MIPQGDKMNNRKHLFFVSLCVFVLQTNAFSWKFFNETNEALVIKAKLIASSREFFSLIEPGQVGTITPGEQDKVMEGFCLGSIEYAEHKKDTDLKEHTFTANVSVQLPLCDNAEFNLTKQNEKIVISKRVKDKDKV